MKKPFNLKYVMLGDIKSTATVKHLNFMIDEKLNFKTPLEYACKNI